MTPFIEPLCHRRYLFTQYIHCVWLTLKTASFRNQPIGRLYPLHVLGQIARGFALAVGPSLRAPSQLSLQNLAAFQYRSQGSSDRQSKQLAH